MKNQISQVNIDIRKVRSVTFQWVFILLFIKISINNFYLKSLKLLLFCNY